ncbi:ParA family protein [Candidatus Dojkabacteria bacterium]|nr:ParA family protein [Candidatus Dojkabacteria bacterium]
MIIVFSNQKGGVGKTTTVLNLGSYLAEMGKKVLLIDLDPQANLTSGTGYSVHGDEKSIPEKTKNKTVYEVLIGDKELSNVFVSTQIENLYLVPSGIELAGAEIELVSMMSRETILKRKIATVNDQFDYILIDCPPSLGLLTINALVAAEQLIIPVQCEYFALEGLGQLINTFNIVKKNLNSTLELKGVVLTMFDSRTRLSKEIVEEVNRFFKDKVFKTIIPRNVRLSESPSHGKPITLYDRSSEGAKSYEKLAKEILSGEIG